ncbi:hypothetical protein FRC04_001852 [Tulasnella sp. 424]|nr:hypothetical protein FRC04_001852 [Tulasnella sp. 424]
MGALIVAGSLSWNTTTDNLYTAFGEFGQVTDAIVMQDRETGRSRGFGFVTFSNPDEAQAAIQGLNEQELDGRRIKVNIANARPSGGGRSGGGGGRRLPAAAPRPRLQSRRRLWWRLLSSLSVLWYGSKLLWGRASSNKVLSCTVQA